MRSSIWAGISSALLVSLLAATEVNTQTPPVGGQLYLTPRANGGECLTAASNSDGAAVIISACTGDSSQEWTFTGGAVTIFGGSKCLDVTNGNTANGNLLQIWTCSTNGNPNQQFWYTTDNHFAWTNHGKCVDLTNGDQSDGTRIQIWDCSGPDTNQLWDYQTPGGSSSGGGGGGGGGGFSQQPRLVTGCTNPNDAALTFDDGPYIYLNDLSDTLTNAGIKGTFFFNGNNWACIYDSDSIARVRYAYNAGHQIGSHTWSHPDLTTLSSSDVNNQMFLVEQALQRIIGITPAFMRPPYGNYNDQVLSVAFSRNQSVVLWDFDSGDSTGSTVAQSEAAYDQLVASHPSNVIALNHETYSTTVYQVLPYAIQKLQSAGYNLVTVAECLGLEPYQSVGSPGTPDSSWTCNGEPTPRR